MYKSFHFVSPLLLDNVLSTKYFISSPTFLSHFIIKEDHILQRGQGSSDAGHFLAQAVKNLCVSPQFLQALPWSLATFLEIES